MTSPKPTVPVALPWWDARSPTAQARQDAARLHAGVPKGWIPLLSETLEGLLGVRTAERYFSLMFMTVEFEDGRLVLDMPYADAVLMGIARRCSNRSRFQCQECGRRAQLRQFGMSEAAVLCAGCAAPEFLHRAIDELDKFSGLIARGGTVCGTVSLPRLLRRSFVEAATGKHRPGSDEPCMDKATFMSWIADLKRLKAVLPRPAALLHPTA